MNKSIADSRRRSGFQRLVAQVSNLLYRRFPIWGISGFAICSPWLITHSLPTGSRRYSRLETCATCTLLLVATGLLLGFNAPAAEAPDKTARLIQVLQSDAPLFDKARACQQLGESGTHAAVPALAALLGDPQLNAYARSGLEGIPDPSAAAALREAAGKLKGPQLAGVVMSLGAVRDTKAVGLLEKLANDPGSGVSPQALLALGNISSPASIRILTRALAKGAEASRPDAAAACLLAADWQRRSGNLKQAAALYDTVRNANLPATLRAAATRGAIVARDRDRVPFLVQQLRSEERVIRNAALLAVREVPDERLAAALNAELGRAQPEMQAQLLLAIADCHNPGSVDAVEAMTRGADETVRQTAFKVLGKLGSPATGVLLASLQKELTPQERALVLDGLRGIPGEATDDRLLKALASASTPRLRVDLIRLLDSREVTNASSELLTHARGNDKEVAIAALSALKPLAAPEQLPGLIELTKSCGDEAVRESAENAIAGACGRFANKETGAEAVLRELSQATKAAERCSWIRILATLGYRNALPAIEAAAGDSDETVALVAMAQLGRWPDTAPMPTLLKSLESTATSGLRQRALLSVLELAATAADEAQVPETMIVSWLQRADAVAQSAAEKRRILGLLGRLKTVESFRLMSGYLDNPELRVEAASGIVQIGPALAKSAEAPALRRALEKISANVNNAELKSQALKLAKTIPAGKETVSLFDGTSLAGWDGDTNIWRVRDGLIVGGSMAGNARNEFLASKRSYTNFVLRLEYKLVGTEGFINSGVQLRSVRVSNPPNEMSGYQADIGAGYSGCLYDESRRNKFLVQCGEQVIKRLEKPGEWNSYEIRCEGNRIQLWLNGEQTVDYTETEPGIPLDGLIALQIHGGSKAEVFFRNIQMQEL